MKYSGLIFAFALFKSVSISNIPKGEEYSCRYILPTTQNPI